MTGRLYLVYCLQLIKSRWIVPQQTWTIHLQMFSNSQKTKFSWTCSHWLWDRWGRCCLESLMRPDLFYCLSSLHRKLISRWDLKRPGACNEFYFLLIHRSGELKQKWSDFTSAWHASGVERGDIRFLTNQESGIVTYRHQQLLIPQYTSEYYHLVAAGGENRPVLRTPVKPISPVNNWTQQLHKPIK